MYILLTVNTVNDRKMLHKSAGDYDGNVNEQQLSQMLI